METKFKQAVQDIKNGKVVAFLTDTVYGLSCDAFNQNAVDEIFNLKRRYEGKPLILLIENGFDISEIVKVTEPAKKLIQEFWPGPLTIIFQAKKDFPNKVCLNGKVSLRMPNDQLCQKLLSACKTPLTSTSANISGEPLLCDAKSIEQTFNITVIDGGVPKNSVPSTIVDCSTEEVKIIRAGAISEEEIFKALKK